MGFYNIGDSFWGGRFKVLSPLNDLPSPVNISYLWNMGSLLGFYLIFQIFSGLFLSFHYVSEVNSSFSSVDLIFRETNYGWIFRFLHVAGSSGFFLLLYLHLGRGLYYYSFFFYSVWLSGCTILVVSMAVGFFGYVLPWGQMSYWGATVITNFCSVIPYFGTDLVIWVWGSFSVDYPTLTRFFSLHFLLPFVILFFLLAHVSFLHHTGSNNPLGLSSGGDKVAFTPYYGVKDLFGVFFVIFFTTLVFFVYPENFMEYQNYIEANSLVTPTHIQPEWYFLGAYAVLRCIPNKLGGVLGLALFVFVFFFYPFLVSYKSRGSSWQTVSQLFFWTWVFNFFFLTWLGSQPVEDPYGVWSQVSTIIYFGYFLFRL